MDSIKRQTQRLIERRTANRECITVSGFDLEIARGVYQTGLDTSLFIDSIEMSASKDFLEIGCGCGAIAIALSSRARKGVACDINMGAVRNTQRNLKHLGILNVRALYSDVFSKISGDFDVVIFNCPYTNHPVLDPVDRMFWDPEDEAKKKFFLQAQEHLRPDGILYFGWADFEYLDIDFPSTLASRAGFHLVETFARPVPTNAFSYYVLKYKRSSS